MKIDYTEFIERHHKIAQPAPIDVPQKRAYKGVVSVLLLCLCAIILLMVTTLTHMNETTRVITGLSFVMMVLLCIAALRAFRVHKKQSRDMTLMGAVLEGSRAARMITDTADNTIYNNTRFENLCRGVGPPGYATLVRLFQNNEEVLSHFNMLADKAHRGLTDSIELFSKFEDNERWLMVTAQPVSGYAGYIHWRVDDVTQKYTLDRAIRQEREKLIDFTDNAPVGFFSVNEKGRFIFANATFARWLGEDLRALLDHGYIHTYLVNPPEGGGLTILLMMSLINRLLKCV